jgi:cysteinyl-tRNA synthetase
VLRFALLSGHYRQPLNFTWESMAAAKSAVNRLIKARSAFGYVAESSVSAGADWDVFAPFWDAICDDVNVPAATGQLFGALNEIGDIAKLEQTSRARAGAAFERVLLVLGLESIREETVEIPPAVAALAEKRWAAKAGKDWALADSLRGELSGLGWEMKDGRDGYTLSPVKG